jgi:SNF family Na+-dependent transporter
MFGSYNKIGHKVHITAAVISSLDFFTSIISGVAVFSILGNLAHQQSTFDVATGDPLVVVNVSHVVSSGPGLAFVTFPEALAQLPLPQVLHHDTLHCTSIALYGTALHQVWAVMFFFMLYLLGLDSEFALIETVLTSLNDMVSAVLQPVAPADTGPQVPRAKKYKTLLVFLLCASCFLMSLPCVSYSGDPLLSLPPLLDTPIRPGAFVFQIMDDYGGGMSVMWIAIAEMFFIMWVYGSNNFAKVITCLSI